VIALYDRDAAHEVALANLLQRKGYASLDAVREEGLEQGLERGLEQGLEKGIEQGLEKGIEQGLEKGIEQGLEKGIEQGLEKGAAALEHLLTRRLARPLTEAERATLRARLRADGSERIGDLVLDLTPDALADWLRTSDAR
jgi:flagellar biosynthesis/type III secretory pathway protein FliH